MAGWRVLEQGGHAVDAVSGAVVALEDCPYFNAGKGAVFTRSGNVFSYSYSYLLTGIHIMCG